MTRYVRQLDEFRCGPIAILNVLKWAGYKMFWGQPVDQKLARTTLTYLCKTDDRSGTDDYDLQTALGFIGKVEPDFHECLSTKNISNCMAIGGMVIIGSKVFEKKKKKGKHIGQWIEHYWCIVKENKGLYTCINYASDKTYTYMTYNQVKHSLRKASGWCVYRVQSR